MKLKDDLYRTGSTPPTEVELLKPDGSHYFVILSSTLTEFEGREAHLTYLYDITEIKQAEQALRESEARMKAIIDTVPAMINLKDRDGHYVMTNRYHSDFFGLEADSLVGKTSSTIDKKHGKRVERLNRQVMETGEALTPYDNQLVDGDGQLRDLMSAKDPLRDLSGEVIGVVSTSIDITERKRAERALQESEARIKTILDTVPAMINVQNRDGRYEMSNRFHSEFFGHEPDALIGKSPEILGEEHAQQVKDINRSVMENGEIYPPYDYQMPDAKGRLRDLLTTKVPLKDLSGKIIGVISTAIDITERKHADEALRQGELRTRTIVNNVIDGIITINERGIIQSVNTATTKIFGYSEENLLGQNVSFLAAEPYRSAHDRYLANYLTTNEPKIIGSVREVEGMRSNGQRFPMELAVTEVELGDERIFIGIVRDITQRKEMERMKSEFISTVSHELRTPLTSIRGSLGLITGGAIGDVPENALDLINLAEKNTGRLILLVNDILDMEKIESGSLEFNFEPLDLSELVKNQLDANRGYADEFEVKFVLADDQPGMMVSGDEERLNQVLANLLSNAAKFSPKGKKVEVAVSPYEENLRVSVTDQGPGIPKEFQDNVFGRFTQADSSDTRQTGGTGLGLNISKSIIDKHGGEIGFKTKTKGKTGTTFFFELPILQ